MSNVAVRHGKAAVITAHGGPECLAIREEEVQAPPPEHVLVKVAASGLNFHDVIERRTGYPDSSDLPMRTGFEGAGIVIANGAEVGAPAIGDRVVWGASAGSHAEYVTMPAASTIPVPDWLSLVDAAAVFSQGLTAHYLATSLRSFTVGDTALVWAAAGGVGRILTQLLVRQGVRVLAATSSEVKAAAAREAGAELSVSYDEVAAAVAQLTGGGKVDVVFDSIGAPTFDTSLSCVRGRGLLVAYGRSGGPVPPVDLYRLSSAGSVQLVRPRLVDFIATREDLVHRASELFSAVEAGDVTVRVDASYALDDIARAHRVLESRTVIGKVVICP